MSNIEWHARLARRLAQEAETTGEVCLWMSFCDPDLPKGRRFLGVIVMWAPGIAHAIARTWELGVNPALWPIKPTRWTVSTAFKRGVRLAGYPDARLHDLRHSTASEMINAGVDLFTVGAVLGHKSAVSTKRYAHLATSTLANALSLVGKKVPTLIKKKAA